MNKNTISRSRHLHLYNPKVEGLGRYDANYINAYKKNKKTKESLIKEDRGRFAAWFRILEAFQS